MLGSFQGVNGRKKVENPCIMAFDRTVARKFSIGGFTFV